jgi:hypothetical protein
MASKQKVYPVDSKQKLQEHEEENSDELRDTKDAFYQYVFAKASRDRQLSQTEAVTLKEVKAELESSEETHGSGDAAEMGRRLAEIGDEVDALYHDEMVDIVQMTGSPERAYGVFVDVVKNLFEWDETTHRANITIGRLGALLAYAYHLCKHYIKTNARVNLVVTFLGVVTTWLFRFLIKAKFYEWLESMGGWGKLISDTTANWGNTLFLVVGISSLLIWGYNFIRNR